MDLMGLFAFTFYSRLATQLFFYHFVATCIIAFMLLFSPPIQSTATNAHCFRIKICAIGVNGLLSLILVNLQDDSEDDMNFSLHFIFCTNAAFMAVIPQLLMEAHFKRQQKKKN